MDIIVDINKHTNFFYPLKTFFVFISKMLLLGLASPFLLINFLKSKKDNSEDISEVNQLEDYGELFKKKDLTIYQKYLDWEKIPKSLNHLDHDDTLPAFQLRTEPIITEIEQFYFKFYHELNNKLFLIASNNHDKNIDSLFVLDLNTKVFSHVQDFDPFFIIKQNVDKNSLTIFGEREWQKYKIKITST